MYYIPSTQNICFITSIKLSEYKYKPSICQIKMSKLWNYSERVLNQGGFFFPLDLTLRQIVAEFLINSPMKRTINHKIL